MAGSGLTSGPKNGLKSQQVWGLLDLDAALWLGVVIARSDSSLGFGVWGAHLTRYIKTIGVTCRMLGRSREYI